MNVGFVSYAQILLWLEHIEYSLPQLRDIDTLTQIEPLDPLIQRISWQSAITLSRFLIIVDRPNAADCHF